MAKLATNSVATVKYKLGVNIQSDMASLVLINSSGVDTVRLGNLMHDKITQDFNPPFPLLTDLVYKGYPNLSVSWSRPEHAKESRFSTALPIFSFRPGES